MAEKICELRKKGGGGGSLKALFPITLRVASNSAAGASNGILRSPVFFTGINSVHIKMTSDTGNRNICKYYALDSDYASGTIFPSTEFDLDVSNVDGYYFQIYNTYTNGEHYTLVTISVNS